VYSFLTCVYSNVAAAPPNGIAACAANASDPNYPTCAVTATTYADGFPIGPNSDPGATWLWSTPGGIRPYLSFIANKYFPKVASKGIVVSEFGFSDPYESSFDTLAQILWDLRRADYMQGYLDNILAARALDGVNITGIFAWAIYDNFEWNSGLSTKFGLRKSSHQRSRLKETSADPSPFVSRVRQLDKSGEAPEGQHVPVLELVQASRAGQHRHGEYHGPDRTQEDVSEAEVHQVTAFELQCARKGQSEVYSELMPRVWRTLRCSQSLLLP